MMVQSGAVSGRRVATMTKRLSISEAADSSVHTLPCNGAAGQFVTVSLAGGDSSGQWLSFCEVQVWGTATTAQTVVSSLLTEADDVDDLSGGVDRDGVLAAHIAKCELAEDSALTHRRCPAHPEKQPEYRFIADGLHAETAASPSKRLQTAALSAPCSVYQVTRLLVVAASKTLASDLCVT